MATINSSNQDYTNNADGWSLAGGTAKRKLTVQSGDITLSGAPTALSLGGDLITSGGNSLTLTTSGTTTVTLPTTGTLVAVSGSQNLSTKILAARAGTAAAGTAPIKLTSGTVLAVPEAGAIEFNTDSLYVTTTSGPTRRTVATYDDVSGAAGDMYYRDAGSAFKSLAVGSTGNVLKVASGLPAWGASASPSVYEWYIDNPANWSADIGYDLELNGTSSSLPGGWSWVNQGTSTWAEAYGAGCIDNATGAGSSIHSIVRGFPTPPTWTTTIKLIMNAAVLSGTSAGLVMRSSSTGRMMLFALTDLIGVSVTQWVDNTTSSTQHAVQNLMEQPRYLRITRNSSTSYTYQWSCDGAIWMPLLNAHNPTGYVTPDQIGFFVNRPTLTTSSSGSMHWFRVR